MDEDTFHAELQGYPVRRSKDYIKVRYNKRANTKRKVKDEEDAVPEVDTMNVENDAGFWEYLESALKGIDNIEKSQMNKFFAALRNEHRSLAPKLNLSDLDFIAASLVQASS